MRDRTGLSDMSSAVGPTRKAVLRATATYPSITLASEIVYINTEALISPRYGNRSIPFAGSSLFSGVNVRDINRRQEKAYVMTVRTII